MHAIVWLWDNRVRFMALVTFDYVFFWYNLRYLKRNIYGRKYDNIAYITLVIPVTQSSLYVRILTLFARLYSIPTYYCNVGETALNYCPSPGHRFSPTHYVMFLSYTIITSTTDIEGHIINFDYIFTLSKMYIILCINRGSIIIGTYI